jgi:hypothetical protein
MRAEIAQKSGGASVYRPLHALYMGMDAHFFSIHRKTRTYVAFWKIPLADFPRRSRADAMSFGGHRAAICRRMFG